MSKADNQYKAKIVGSETKEYEAVIYAAGRWRVMGTPYSPKNGGVKTYATPKAAQRGAESTAAALGITLKWEDK